MSQEASSQSTLFIGTGDDDAVVLVVGGFGGTGEEASLFSNRPHEESGEQGSRDRQWKWRQLSPMQEKRTCRPGLLMLGPERFLVCGGGGYYGSKTTELLQLPRAHNEKGVWTLIAKQMINSYIGSFLVNLNDRVVAVGFLFIKIVSNWQKQPLFNMVCLHLGDSKRCEELCSTSTSGVLVRPHSIPGEQYQHLYLPPVSFCLSGGTTGDIRVETPARLRGRRIYRHMLRYTDFSTLLASYYTF